MLTKTASQRCCLFYSQNPKLCNGLNRPSELVFKLLQPDSAFFLTGLLDHVEAGPFDIVDAYLIEGEIYLQTCRFQNKFS